MLPLDVYRLDLPGRPDVCHDCRRKGWFPPGYLEAQPNRRAATALQTLPVIRWPLSAYQKRQVRAAFGHRCGICKSIGVRLAIDHDHDTLVVRGLLCTLCNTGLGHFKERISLLRAAIQYLASPPLPQPPKF